MNEYTCRRVKWNTISEQDNIQPFGLAEMEFGLDKKVQDEIAKYMSKSIMGYSQAPESYYKTIGQWMRKAYNEKIVDNDIVITPGVVPAIKTFIELRTEASKEVLILTPAYNNFYKAIEDTNRSVKEVELNYDNGTYSIDFDLLEAALKEETVEMMVMCNPHNPIGRLWTKEELTKVLELCRANNVFLISDEIHGDIIFEGHTFTSMLNLDMSIPICTSGSKTFNIAGFKTANIIIHDDQLHDEFCALSNKKDTLGSGAIGVFGTEKSYELSENWFLDKLEIIQKNVETVNSLLEDTNVIVTKQNATYLMWLNFNYYLEKNDKFFDILDEQGIHFSVGTMYGQAGKGFARVNVGTTEENVKVMILKLKEVLEKVDNDEL